MGPCFDFWKNKRWKRFLLNRLSVQVTSQLSFSQKRSPQKSCESGRSLPPKSEQRDCFVRYSSCFDIRQDVRTLISCQRITEQNTVSKFSSRSTALSCQLMPKQKRLLHSSHGTTVCLKYHSDQFLPRFGEDEFKWLGKQNLSTCFIGEITWRRRLVSHKRFHRMHSLLSVSK